MKTFLLLISVALVVPASVSSDETPREEQKYLVIPGVNAELDEVDKWTTGWASPFNVLFGPKPYVIGWFGEAGAPDRPGEGDDGLDVDDGSESDSEKEN